MKKARLRRKARLLEYGKMRNLAMARDKGRCIYPLPNGDGKWRCGAKATGGIDHLTGRTISKDPDFGDPSHPKNLAAACLACHSNKTFEKVRNVLLYLKRRYGYDYSERRYRRYHLYVKYPRGK